ncbi:MAG: penicillin-binding protein [Flavobacteriaceae bacterium]|nr:penicillin-binding protein [Flavobacteriaceae bacterium]|tara:strand:+ start:23602 stop:25575 length:1974 start_codon:yes stop_codon:yes gene_type:complete
MKKRSQNLGFRLYFVSVVLLLFAFSAVFKIFYIQTIDGDKYKKIGDERTLKNIILKPIRGDIYSDDQSILATSIVKYQLNWDSKVVPKKLFNKHKYEIAKGIAKVTSKDYSDVLNLIEKAKDEGNRYLLIGKNLNYNQQNILKKLPIFNLSPNKGGLIIKNKIFRERPLGKIAERTIGYEKPTKKGTYYRVGLEGAYASLLEGKEGYRLKRKIANGQWKAIRNTNEREPTEGYDIHTTINTNFQDLAHNTLLNQLEKYEAQFGTVILMEVKTGAIKAIVNLGRTNKGAYYEKLNYAVGFAQEPGSTFKLISMMAALEDNYINPGDIVQTGNGERIIYGKTVRDSKKGGYGKITASKVFEVSSNTGIVNIIYDNYKDNPKKFVDRIYNMGIHKPLGIPIKGEANPKIPYPTDRDWNGLSLPWMAWGYGVALTPLQILSFYNAVANDGVMVKPNFIKQIGKMGSKPHIKFNKKIINPSICSEKTLKIVKEMLSNVVKKKWGTANNIKDENINISGKTGTTQINYNTDSIEYNSSFVGYFPSDKPRYSCIVVINKPNKKIGYYGAKVAAPVFHEIARRVHSGIFKEEAVSISNLKKSNIKNIKITDRLPNLIGYELMDVIHTLESLGKEVIIIGKKGKVKTQSILPGTLLNKFNKIVLEV